MFYKELAMKNYIKFVSLSVSTLICSLALAQTPTDTKPATDPSAASTPHQRDVTKTPAQEAKPEAGTNPGDSSTEPQKKALKKNHSKNKQTPPPST